MWVSAFARVSSGMRSSSPRRRDLSAHYSRSGVSLLTLGLTFSSPPSSLTLLYTRTICSFASVNCSRSLSFMTHLNVAQRPFSVDNITRYWSIPVAPGRSRLIKRMVREKEIVVMGSYRRCLDRPGRSHRGLYKRGGTLRTQPFRREV